jgi:hypothetical protein
MNERIKAIKRQAEDYASKYGIKHQVFGQELIDVLDEKFVELIISECQAALWTKECMQSDLALEEFKRNYTKIKEHFGVEE